MKAGDTHQIKIENKGNLTENDIQRMIEEAKKYEAEDAAYRATK